MKVRASDQRREKRRELLADQPLLVEVTSAGSKTHGMVLNISHSGMAVQTFRPLVEGPAEIHPVLDNVAGFEGSVAWQQPGGVAGIRLLGVPAQTATDLQHWIEETSKQNSNGSSLPLLACRSDSNTDDFEQTLHLFASSAMSLTEASGAAIALALENEVECRATVGIAPDKGTKVDPDIGLSGLSLRTGEVVTSGDLWSDSRVRAATALLSDIRSIAIVPIVSAGNVTGLIEVFSQESDCFNRHHINQLQLLARVIAEEIREQSDLLEPALSKLNLPFRHWPQNDFSGVLSIDAGPASHSDSILPDLSTSTSYNFSEAVESSPPASIPSEGYLQLFGEHRQALAVVAGITVALLVGLLAVALFGPRSQGTDLETNNHVPATQNFTEGARAKPDIIFTPSEINQKVGAIFGVNVVVRGARNLSVVPLQILYDPRRLQVLTVTGGDLLERDGHAAALVQRVDAAAGKINVSISRPSSAPGISGDGTVCIVSFMSKAAGRSTLRISQTNLRDSSAKTISVNGSEANVLISSKESRPVLHQLPATNDASSASPAVPIALKEVSQQPVEIPRYKQLIRNEITPQRTPSNAIPPLNLPDAVAPLPISSTQSAPTPGFALANTLMGHTKWVTTVAFSADGRHLVSSSWDQSIKLWDIASGRVLAVLASKLTGIQASVISHDGRFIAAEDASNNIHIWNSSTGAELRTIKGNRSPWDQSWVYSIAFSPNDRLIAAALDAKTVCVWDVKTGSAFQTFTGNSRAYLYIAFSPNGQLLATGADSKSIEIWNLNSGKPLRTIKAHKQEIYAIAFSPDGRLLASASKDKTVKLWDVSTGTEVQTLAGHQDSVTSLAFSSNSRWLATSGWDKTIRIWDTVSGRQIQTLTGHSHPIYSLAFDSRDGYLASGSEDGSIKLWRLRPEIDLAVLNENANPDATISAVEIRRP